MALVYATAADLIAATNPNSPSEDEALALVTAASALVRYETRRALYQTTAAGLPDDTDTADAFRDATLAQAKAWHQLGVNPSLGAASVTAAASSVSIGRAKVDTGARSSDSDKISTLHQLVPAAAAHLAALGLLSAQPSTYRGA